MKKYFLSIVALAGMLFATSCQESLVEPQMEGPTTFTVQLPEGMGTKAIGDASNVNKLFVEVYSNGTSIFKKSQEITNGSTTVSLDLIKGQEYQIVFWAQKDNSYITDFTTQGLAEISIPTGFHNNESGAAFYAYETFKIDGNAKTVTLRRPFAQLNLGTTALSLDTDASSSDVQLLSSSVTLATATKFSTIFGAGINVDTRTYTASISSFGDEKLTLANGDEYVYVSMDFLPVVYGRDVVELGVVIETNLGTITHNFTNVPIQKNYRTNIVGNLISSKTDFVVEVEDEWAGEENYNAEWGNLLSAAKNGGTLTLSADVVVPETIIIEKDLTLNLNGKTIKNEIGTKASAVGTDVIIVNEGATLTIEGDGTIEAVSGNDGYAIISEGIVIINGGTIKSGIDQNNEPNAVVYARKNGKVYVNGGEFPNEHKSKFVLNKKDAHRATTTIEVRGGKFYNFNPQNNAAEGDNTNFVADGYGVYEKDGCYEVMYTAGVKEIDAVVNNSDELSEAIDNGKKAIVLAAGEYGTIVAENGITYIGSEGAKVDCVNLNGADNVTIKNITFDAATAKYGYDGAGTKKVYAFSNIITGDDVFKPNKGAHNLVIDGCTFTGTFANPGAPIAFTDQKRVGGFSGNITIKNCTFDNTNANYVIYGYYTGDSTNGHGDFVIENNTFKTKCYAGPIYLGRYASSIPVVVKNNIFETVSSINDAIYVQDHSNYGVSVDASDNTFAE